MKIEDLPHAHGKICGLSVSRGVMREAHLDEGAAAVLGRSRRRQRMS